MEYVKCCDGDVGRNIAVPVTNQTNGISESSSSSSSSMTQQIFLLMCVGRDVDQWTSFKFDTIISQYDIKQYYITKMSNRGEFRIPIETIQFDTGQYLTFYRIAHTHNAQVQLIDALMCPDDLFKSGPVVKLFDCVVHPITTKRTNVEDIDFIVHHKRKSDFNLKFVDGMLYISICKYDDDDVLDNSNKRKCTETIQDGFSNVFDAYERFHEYVVDTMFGDQVVVYVQSYGYNKLNVQAICL